DPTVVADLVVAQYGPGSTGRRSVRQFPLARPPYARAQSLVGNAGGRTHPRTHRTYRATGTLQPGISGSEGTSRSYEPGEKRLSLEYEPRVADPAQQYSRLCPNPGTLSGSPPLPARWRHDDLQQRETSAHAH